MPKDYTKKIKDDGLSRRDFIKLFGRGAKYGVGILAANAILPERAYAEFFKVIYRNEFNETGKVLADYPEFVPVGSTNLSNDVLISGKAEAIPPGNSIDRWYINSAGTDTHTRHTVGYEFHPGGQYNVAIVAITDGVSKWVQSEHYQSAGSIRVRNDKGELSPPIYIGTTDQYKVRILKDGDNRVTQVSVNNGAFQDLATYTGWGDSPAMPQVAADYSSGDLQENRKINIDDIVIETTQQVPINNTNLAIAAFLGALSLIKLREKIKE